MAEEKLKERAFGRDDLATYAKSLKPETTPQKGETESLENQINRHLPAVLDYMNYSSLQSQKFPYSITEEQLKSIVATLHSDLAANPPPAQQSLRAAVENALKEGLNRQHEMNVLVEKAEEAEKAELPELVAQWTEEDIHTYLTALYGKHGLNVEAGFDDLSSDPNEHILNQIRETLLDIKRDDATPKTKLRKGLTSEQLKAAVTGIIEGQQAAYTSVQPLLENFGEYYSIDSYLPARELLTAHLANAKSPLTTANLTIGYIQKGLSEHPQSLFFADDASKESLVQAAMLELTKDSKIQKKLLTMTPIQLRACRDAMYAEMFGVNEDPGILSQLDIFDEQGVLKVALNENTVLPAYRVDGLTLHDYVKERATALIMGFPDKIPPRNRAEDVTLVEKPRTLSELANELLEEYNDRFPVVVPEGVPSDTIEHDVGLMVTKYVYAVANNPQAQAQLSDTFKQMGETDLRKFFETFHKEVLTLAKQHHGDPERDILVNGKSLSGLIDPRFWELTKAYPEEPEWKLPAVPVITGNAAAIAAAIQDRRTYFNKTDRLGLTAQLPNQNDLEKMFTKTAELQISQDGIDAVIMACAQEACLAEPGEFATKHLLGANAPFIASVKKFGEVASLKPSQEKPFKAITPAHLKTALLLRVKESFNPATTPITALRGAKKAVAVASMDRIYDELGHEKGFKRYGEIIAEEVKNAKSLKKATPAPPHAATSEEPVVFSPPPSRETPAASNGNATTEHTTNSTSTDPQSDKISVGPMTVTRTQLGVVGSILGLLGLASLFTSKETQQQEGTEETVETYSGWKILAGGLSLAAAAVAGVYLWRNRVGAPAPSGQNFVR